MSHYMFKIKCRRKIDWILINQLHSYLRAINLPWIKNKKEVSLELSKTYDGLIYSYIWDSL